MRNRLFTCDSCDFRGKSQLQMRKHFMVRHSEKPECHFWRRGQCNAGTQCSFTHTPRTPVCRNRETCLFWPWCKFSHPEICRFQMDCSNSSCNFFHLSPENFAFLEDGRKKQNQPPNQQSPVWRPW